jgi:GNAT superfamily N-acetyltransferase
MTVILGDLAPSSILRAMDANLAGYCLPFGRLPHGELHDDATLTWFISGVQEESFNGVARAVLEPDAVGIVVEDVLAQFRRRGVPMHWQIGPTTSPSTLGSTLLAHGFTYCEDEPGMALDLHAMHEDVHVLPDLTIEQVTTHAQLRQWIEVWGCGAPVDVRRCWDDVFAALGVAPERPWRYYLGCVGGTSVAVVKLFYAAGIVSVQHVVTLPSMRRRGIGTALTVHALRAARDQGYRLAVLTSSPDGFNCYQRIGFQTYCAVSRYRWHP